MKEIDWIEISVLGLMALLSLLVWLLIAVQTCKIFGIDECDNKKELLQFIAVFIFWPIIWATIPIWGLYLLFKHYLNLPDE